MSSLDDDLIVRLSLSERHTPGGNEKARIGRGARNEGATYALIYQSDVPPMQRLRARRIGFAEYLQFAILGHFLVLGLVAARTAYSLTYAGNRGRHDGTAA